VSELTQTVLLGTTLLGGVAGVVGSFAVLRRRALMGDLLSHAALPGLCLAFLLLGTRHHLGMLLGALVTGLVGVTLIAVVTRWTRTKQDAALGIVLSTFFGAGIVLASIIQRLSGGASRAGLTTYIYGQAAGMLRQDVWAIAAVAVLSLAVVILLYKEFKVLSFDPEFARTQGWPTLALDMLQMSILALVTVTGLPAVGVILMAAMLIIPGAAARFWTNRLEWMLVLSGILGAAAGALGTLLSAGILAEWLGLERWSIVNAAAGLPTGPVIVLAGTAIFLFSVLFAPRRGVVARSWADLRLRSKTADENLLRTLYELSEPRLPALEEVTIDQLLRHRAWTRLRALWLVRRAAKKGLAEPTPGGARLTPAGLAEARRLVRIHRLWEQFLVSGASIAPDHVDRDADSIEHLLTPAIVEQLEAQIAADRPLLPSPHEIEQPRP